MHANRNEKAVKRVERGMMKANRIRNLFAVFAIILTTFMITTVFSLGINYTENMKLMQVRTAGTTADVSLAMPTKAQEQQIQDNKIPHNAQGAHHGAVRIKNASQ